MCGQVCTCMYHYSNITLLQNFNNCTRVLASSSSSSSMCDRLIDCMHVRTDEDVDRSCCVLLTSFPYLLTYRSTAGCIVQLTATSGVNA